MKSLSISRRLKIGLGSLAGAILALAIAAVGSALFLSQQFASYRAESRAATAANEIAEDIFEAQLAADAYRRAPAPELLEEFDGNLAEVSDSIASMQDDAALPAAFTDYLRFLSDEKSRYASGFADVTAAEASIAEDGAAFYDQGVAAREAVSTLMDAANRAADSGQTFNAARVQEALLLGRVYMTRYTLTGNEEDYAKASEALAHAAQQLSWMSTMPGDRDRGALIGAARERMAALIDTTARLHDGIILRGQAFARMDESRSAIFAQSERAIDLITGNLVATGSLMDRTFSTTAFGLLAAALMAFAYALFMMRSTIRQIGREFDTTLHTVTELADGNLEIRIEGTEHQTELGQIARALEVFRAKSKEAEELARQNEAEKTRAAAEKRRRDEEAREAEHRRQVAEQEAAEARKREIFDALRAAVSGVVTAAASGDFSGRVDTGSLDPELRGLADDINRLMANVERGLGEIAKVSARLAEGDLREGMGGQFEGTFKALQDNIEAMISSLGGLLAEIAGEAELVSQQSVEMTRGAEDLSRRAESQAASLEETSASMAEIASSAESNATAAAETDTAATAMNEEAARARDVLRSTITAMRDIEEGSKEIEAIVDVIEDIAFQTNLLSLNASVEAARAGEAGKGFAVVANEVRALAQRSAEASSKVQTIITHSTGAIGRGSDAVEQTGEAIERIVARIKTVTDNLREIKSASDEQATAVKDISNAFAQLDKITQKNAAVAEETRGTAAMLSSQSRRMQDAVGKVQLREAEGHGRHAGASGQQRTVA